MTVQVDSGRIPATSRVAVGQLARTPQRTPRMRLVEATLEIARGVLLDSPVFLALVRQCSPRANHGSFMRPTLAALVLRTFASRFGQMRLSAYGQQVQGIGLAFRFRIRAHIVATGKRA